MTIRDRNLKPIKNFKGEPADNKLLFSGVLITYPKGSEEPASDKHTVTEDYITEDVSEFITRYIQDGELSELELGKAERGLLMMKNMYPQLFAKNTMVNCPFQCKIVKIDEVFMDVTIKRGKKIERKSIPYHRHAEVLVKPGDLVKKGQALYKF